MVRHVCKRPLTRPGVHTCMILGPPRSGTTLLGYLLAGGEGVLAMSEPFLTLRVVGYLRLHKFYGKFQKEAGLKRRVLPPGGDYESFWRYLQRLALDNGLRHLVIKETYRPEGLNAYWSNAEAIELLMPAVHQVLLIIRHPCDTAGSSIRFCRWVTGPRGWLMRYFWPTVPNFRSPTEVVRLAARNWVHFVRWTRAKGLRPIRYEDVVRSPNDALRDICDRLRIPYDPQMLESYEPRKRYWGLGDVKTILKPRPIDTSAIGDPSRQLTDEQRRIVQETCEDHVGEFDYDL